MKIKSCFAEDIETDITINKEELALRQKIKNACADRIVIGALGIIVTCCFFIMVAFFPIP